MSWWKNIFKKKQKDVWWTHKEIYLRDDNIMIDDGVWFDPADIGCSGGYSWTPQYKKIDVKVYAQYQVSQTSDNRRIVELFVLEEGNNKRIVKKEYYER